MRKKLYFFKEEKNRAFLSKNPNFFLKEKLEKN